MFNARQLIRKHGATEARRRAESKAERACVEAAIGMMSADDSVVQASRAVTSLPHRAGQRLTEWEQDAGDGVYRWRSGEEEGEPLGLPFGAKSRMILIYLFNHAVVNNTNKIECGDTLYKWNALTNNKSVGGMTYQILTQHSRRIVQCDLGVSHEGAAFQEFGKLARSPAARNLGWFAADRRRAPPLKAPVQIELNESFFQQLKSLTVPVRLAALRQISNNSAAIDLYIRLSDGLPRFSAPRLATWSELKRRFGGGYKNIRQMKPAFLDTVNLVSAIYPEARLRPAPEGVVLYPSPGPGPLH